MCLQCGQQLAVDAAKATIAHADDVVARAYLGHDLLHHGIDRVGRPGRITQRLQGFGSIPVQTCGVAEGQIGFLERPGQLRLHGPA